MLADLSIQTLNNPVIVFRSQNNPFRHQRRRRLGKSQAISCDVMDAGFPL